MTITRAQMEAVLVKRCGKLLDAADLDGTTIDGSNEDLSDPIATALRNAGYSVADLSAVADADLALVDADDTDKVLDLAELRTLESIEGNYDDVNISVTDRSESLNQLAIQVQKKIERLAAKCQKLYGIGNGSIEAGVLGLDFMQKDGDEQSLWGEA
jgi:poly-gamma-glutamate capsule biosynthesis protein CapA/YwtB (metallophosphatase superfamily)